MTSDLHPLAAQFADVADAYDRGRPEYAPAVVGALAAELGLAPGAAVLDLAAGTGKFTRALLHMDLDVVAVEPLPELREVLAAGIGSERVRAGRAEKIPLPDGAVVAVTVADAFHWFDQTAALGEIRRVLRPGGALAVLSTAPDWRDAPWGHELGTLISGLRPPHPHLDGPPWQAALRAVGGWTKPRELRVTAPQPADPDRLVDYVASMSWVAAMAEDQRTHTLARVRAIVGGSETPAQLPIHVNIGLTIAAEPPVELRSPAPDR